MSVTVCGRWGSWQETDLPPLLHGASSVTPCACVHHSVRYHGLWGWTSLEKETGCHHSKWSKCEEVLCTSWISEPTCHLKGKNSRVCSRALLWVSCLVAEVILTCTLLSYWLWLKYKLHSHLVCTLHNGFRDEALQVSCSISILWML